WEHQRPDITAARDMSWPAHGLACGAPARAPVIPLARRQPLRLAIAGIDQGPARQLTFRTPQAVVKYIFLMVLWPLRGHNHRRIDVSQQEQGARVPRGSEVCRSYHPLSRRTPSTICPLSKPMPTNWGLSASSITTYLQKWRWTRARSCWGSCWIR